MISPPSGQAPDRQRSSPSNYRVKPGDTLTSIASHLDTSVRELALANKIKDPNRLQPGMTIHAPTGAGGIRRYKVQRGDTLAKIARKFGTSVSSLKTANQLHNPNLIQQGQELLIP
jgi:LysM repeat protein